MQVLRSLLVGILIFTIGVSLPASGSARQWRASPSAQAQEYTQIIDQRSRTEVVFVWWIAPEIVDEQSPNAERARAILREYMLVAVARANVSPLGQFTFDSATSPLIQTPDGKARRPLAQRTLPPAVTAVVSMMQAVFSQALGQFGQGVQWYVFDGKGIESCGKGALWVAYAGEQYGYATPIPGCRQSTARSPGA
ncbi:MAG: hypothetical protein ACE5HK_02890 [Candidatus Methylomirabilales bacterium]